MKKPFIVFLISFLTLSAILQGQEANSGDGDFYVLLIGISEYHNIHNLPNVKNDIDSIKKVLEEKYNATILPPILDSNATRSNIHQWIAKEIKRICSENDKLLIYFSGHGDYDPETKIGYWRTYDAKQKDINGFEEGISNYDLTAWISPLKTKHILIMADACFSGAFVEQRVVETGSFTIANRMKRTSRYCITSGGLTEVNDGNTKDINSPFAKAFVKVLKENNNKYLTSEYLGKLLEEVIPLSADNLVINKAKIPEYQKPQKGKLKNVSDESGIFAFIYENGIDNSNESTNYNSTKVPIEKTKTTLTMGVVNAVGSVETYIKEYSPYIKYIADKLNMKYELRVLGYEQIAGQLLSDQIDIAVFSPFSYIDARDNNPDEGIELFAIPKTHGKMGYHPIIIAQKNIPSIDSLKNKRFLFTHTYSTSGLYVPLQLFNNYQIDYTDLFGSYGFSGGHFESIDSLYYKTTDAIATYREAFMEKEDTPHVEISNYNILMEGPEIPNNAYVLSPSLNNKLKEKIKRVMFGADAKRLSFFSADSSGTKIKNKLGIEKWIEASDEDYNDIRVFLKKKRTKHKLSFNMTVSDKIKEMYLNDYFQILSNDISYSLLNSNRWSENSYGQNSRIPVDRIHLELLCANPKKINFNIYFNNKKINTGNISKKVFEKEKAFTKTIKSKVLGYLTINTKLMYDPKNENWAILYGKSFLKDIQNYYFETTLNNGETITFGYSDLNEDKIKDNVIVFPEKYNNYYVKDNNVKITYEDNE